ncbi:hypothetical protein [Seohaeicola zhoushanensis]|uniref:Uncharacterized protein n=1 Tax=Seohaeicola zhoushanensis TaxID=1569283 RepID=A0A8J3GZS9_9RHOB|nr:hypothetical protein [Seohaeicola zhoushanensis]GHF56941.1 hypothetical protein GCM10017056_30480 [Seohaeicola zhoushanensis]
MTLATSIEPVVDRLQTALDRKLFPSEWQQWGARLLDHLRKPVQVAVIGLPGSGKSTLINMMLPEVSVAALAGVPVVEIAHGSKLRTSFELQDGQYVRGNGALTAGDVPAGAVRARVEMPVGDLARQNFVEVSLNGAFGHQVSMVNWVAQWADIVLWCTEDFDASEQKLWAGVPEEVKDHSFLVLTMADRQMMRGILQERINALQPLVAEEFLGLYPIATIQAITARTASQQVNTALWRSSGGKELFDGLLRQVDNGRTADMDQAQMLLNQFAPQIDAAARRAQPEVTNLLAVSPEAAEAATTAPNGGEAFGEALSLLQAQANEMVASFASAGDPKPADILERCVATANQLAELFQAAGGSEVISRSIQSDTQEGAEMMLLFQLEKDEDAAVDAVTLLLQLKKEIGDKTTSNPGH